MDRIDKIERCLEDKASNSEENCKDSLDGLEVLGDMNTKDIIEKTEVQGNRRVIEDEASSNEDNSSDSLDGIKVLQNSNTKDNRTRRIIEDEASISEDNSSSPSWNDVRFNITNDVQNNVIEDNKHIKDIINQAVVDESIIKIQRYLMRATNKKSIYTAAKVIKPTVIYLKDNLYGKNTCFMTKVFMI